AEAFVALADPRHPLLLWIEDLTCLDADSVTLLRFLNDRLPQSALVIAGGHPLDGGTTSNAVGWLQHPATRKHLAWVEVPPIGTDALAQSVAASLGIPFDAPPPEAADLVQALAAWIERRWGGSPMAQDLALRLLVSREALLPDATRRLHGMPWRVDPDALERVRIPDTTAALLGEWLATLPEGLILALEAAATLPGAITLEGLSVAMDGFPAEALQERLEAAVHHGVLYRAWDGLRFVEPALRQAIVQATSAIRSELCHQALGAAVEARTDAPPLLRHHEATCHFRAGGDPERADVHALALVSAALGTGALHTAIAAYSALPESARQRLSHGDCLSLIAAFGAVEQHQEAVELASRRLAATVSEAEQADLWMAQADQVAAQGELVAALSAAEQALSLLGESLPSHSVGAALVRLADGAARRYGEFLSNATGGPPTRLTADEERHCRALETYALIAARQHTERATAADERILRIAVPRAVSGYLIRALIRMGRLEAHPDARPLQEAVQLLQGADLPSEAMALEMARGDGALAQGELLRAREALDRARTSARALGDLQAEAEAELALFHVACLQGPAEGLMRCAERLQRLTVLTRSLDLEVVAKAADAVARAASGDADPTAMVGAVVAAAEHFAARAKADAARRWITTAMDLMLTLGHSAEARRCIALTDRLGDPRNAWEAGRVIAAFAEWHLTLAMALPDQPHPLQQVRSNLKALRAAGRDHAHLATLCEGLSGIERIAQGRVKEGVAQVAALEAAFDAQGARLLWGRMCLRVAEALKPAGD
ncbi:MAG TPA: hypothetical protein VF678_16300, partial [bacterium]